MRSRIAEALGVQSGDTVDFFVAEIGETWSLQITVRDDIPIDVLIHNLFDLSLAITVLQNKSGMTIALESGTVLHSPKQEMWDALKTIEKKDPQNFSLMELILMVHVDMDFISNERTMVAETFLYKVLGIVGWRGLAMKWNTRD